MIRPSRFFLALHALASVVIAKGVIYYWGHVLMHDGTVVALGCVCTYWLGALHALWRSNRKR